MKQLKVIILFFLGISGTNAQSEQLEILLIGASHNYAEAQDVSGVHQKIAAFKPEAFFGEWLSPEDEKRVHDYWNKENVKARTKRLYDKRPIAEEKLPGVIAELKQKVNSNPSDFKAKVDLAHAYYLGLDAGNGYYQMWQVSKALKRNPADAALFEYAKLVLSPWTDSLHKVINAYSNNEYDLIAFPMMQKLGLQEMYAMDSQEFDPFWGEAWAYSDSLASLYEQQIKRDSLSAEALQYKAIRKKEKDLALLYKNGVPGYGPNRKTELLNTPQVDDYLFRVNIVSPELLTLRGFPAHAFQEKLHWWMMRNITMCQNTIDRAKAGGFKRVAVIVGAGHRYSMATLFSQMPGVKLVNLLDLR